MTEKKKPQLFHLNYFVVLLCILISLLFFGVMIYPNYAADSYTVATVGSSGDAATFIASGRIFSALFVKVVMQLGLSIANQMRISYLIAILSTSATIYCTYIILKKLNIVSESAWRDRLRAKIILLLLATPIAISPLYIEYYSFYERGIMSLGVFLAFAGSFLFDHYLISRDKKMLTLSIVAGLLSILCYQGCYGAYLILNCFISLLRSKNTKQLIMNTMLGGICYLVPAILEFVLMKSFIRTTRASSGFNLIVGVKSTLPHLREIFSLWDIIPNNTIVVVSAVLLLIVAANSIITRKVKPFAHYVLSASYIFLVCLVAALAPSIAQSASHVGIAPRIVYPFGMVIGLWLVLAFRLCNILVLRKIVLVATTIFLCIECYKYNLAWIGRFQTNAIDYYKSSQIQDKIDHYESKSGKRIKKIAFVAPNAPATSYPVSNPSGINGSAFSYGWSDYSILNMYFDRHYKRVDASDNDIQYCLEHVKHIFTSDQIRFDGDKAVICSY